MESVTLYPQRIFLNIKIAYSSRPDRKPRDILVFARFLLQHRKIENSTERKNEAEFLQSRNINQLWNRIAFRAPLKNKPLRKLNLTLFLTSLFLDT